MPVYTDIAAELWQPGKGALPDGVQFETRYVGETTITRVFIQKEGLARRKGRYTTVDTPNLAYIDPHDRRYTAAIAHELANLLPEEGDILVAGLGNRHLAADSLGPAVCDQVLVTRHIPVEEDERAFIKLRRVAAVCPGIQGKTGLAAADTLSALAQKLKPAAIICVDSLSTSKPGRLGCSVQLTDTGICPGGREADRLDRSVLGVPVIGIGVPTVMDAAELCPCAHRLVVAPQEIDLIVNRAAAVLALAINRALQRRLTLGELRFLTS